MPSGRRGGAAPRGQGGRFISKKGVIWMAKEAPAGGVAFMGREGQDYALYRCIERGCAGLAESMGCEDRAGRPVWRCVECGVVFVVEGAARGVLAKGGASIEQARSGASVGVILL